MECNLANYALFLSNVADKHRKIDASQFDTINSVSHQLLRFLLAWAYSACNQQVFQLGIKNDNFYFKE